MTSKTCWTPARLTRWSSNVRPRIERGAICEVLEAKIRGACVVLGRKTLDTAR
ncbi:hypothetical protein [Piscinibacter sp. XHJ-5]|uniref:hypothetical protein n=1 Tax=Piscinibacter sp. XHJ-5 TaxID=3037797 RepID=UPI002452DEEA|nr:hypothetical protein [Piscinibacter sp. XHJ-5]